MNLYEGSENARWRLWFETIGKHTHMHRPLLGGLLSPKIIPRRWWWVWNTFTVRLYFSLSCHAGSDVNAVLLRLLFLRAFALPQVFAKTHQQTSYYTERERERGKGVACRDTKEEGNRLGHLLDRNKCLWENLTWQAAILAEQAFRRNY